MLDGDENMENGRLARMLRHQDLDIQDLVKLLSNTEGPQSENKCRKIRAGEVPFSDKL